MIVTVTPNPSLDRTIVLTELVKGELNRAVDTAMDPGGKGVNVSVALAVNGHPTTAILPAGGADGRYLAELLEAAGVETRLVLIEGITRSNISLVELGGINTKVNTAGPSLDHHELQALNSSTIELSMNAEWVVACGSLPRGVPNSFYADLVGGVASRIAVDTTGLALIAAVDAGADLIKPNLAELAEATNTTLPTLGDVVATARSFRDQGAKTVLVSLGRYGAVLVEDEVHYGTGIVTDVMSSVGAGDALLAGFLSEPAGGRTALETGLAWASASCETANTEMPTPERIAKQDVTVFDSPNLEMRVV